MNNVLEFPVQRTSIDQLDDLVSRFNDGEYVGIYAAITKSDGSILSVEITRTLADRSRIQSQ